LWIWHARRDEKPGIRRAPLSGEHRFGLLDRVMKADGTDIDVWSARDALLLKPMTIVLVPVSPRGTHVKGNGGAKTGIRGARPPCRATGLSYAST